MAASSTTTISVGEENRLLAPTNVGQTTHNGPRRWERPWSAQEIHAEAGKWSLAGDAGLLQHLQEFSQRMISRTHQIGKEVDGVVHDAKLMDVRVNNVINDFIMLANNQFVENRVYDEDVSQEQNTKQDKNIQQEKTKAEREAELIPQVALALKLGVSVIDNAFERLDPRVVDSDSEDEDTSCVTEPILEAKDPYVTRPLPFLIGSPQFMEDDNVGLVEDISDQEADSDQGSVSESENEKESEGSETEYSTSEESEEDKDRVPPVKHRTQARPLASSSSSVDNSDKDMFTARSGKSSDGAGSGDISASEDEDVQKEKGRPNLPTGGPDLAAELSARLTTADPKHAGHRDDSSGEDDDLLVTSTRNNGRDSLSSKKPVENMNKGKKKKVTVEGKTDKTKLSKHVDEDDDLFGQGYKQEDGVLFGKRGGLFSSSKGLFDDDDKGGDLFDETKKPAAKTQTSKLKDGSLFSGNLADEKPEGNDVTSLAKPDTSSTHTVKKPTAQPAGFSNKGGQGGGGLFDESEEDDLFSEASKKASVQKEKRDTATKKTLPEAKVSDLFIDNEEEDLFGSMTASMTNKKKPSMKGVTVEGYDEEGKVEEKKLEDEQLRKKASPEKKLPPGAVSMFGKGFNPIVAALKKQQQQAQSSDEEEHLGWSEEDRNSRSSSIQSSSSITAKAGEKTRNVTSSSSIFVNDSGEDDLFSSASKFDSKTPTEADSTKKNLSKLDHKKSDSIITVKDSLFDRSGDDEDTDIFGAVVRPAESKRPGKTASLFGRDDDDIGTTKTDTETATQPTYQSTNKKQENTLFNAKEEETVEPLFQNKPSQSGRDPSKKKTQDLFAHDDALFGSGQNEAPSVDLFSSKTSLNQSSQKKEAPKQSPAAPAKKAIPTSTPAATNLFTGGTPAATNLFTGGDSDDDLFSVRQLTKPPPATSAMKTITGVAKTESPVATEVWEADKPEVKEHKKPAGAVSMFGGIDPSTVLRSRKPTSSSGEDNPSAEKDEKQKKKEDKKTLGEEKTLTKVPVSISKPSADLFGAEEDDNDLFAPKTAAVGIAAKEHVVSAGKEAVTTSKPEISEHQKPAGAISLFDEIEPFVLPKETVVEPKEHKIGEGIEKEKSFPPQTAPKPKVIPKEKQDDSVMPTVENITPNNDTITHIVGSVTPKDGNIIPKDGNITLKDGNITPKDGNITPKSSHGKGTELFGTDADDSDDLFAVTKKQKTPPPVAPRMLAATMTKSPMAAPDEALKPEPDSMSPGPVRPKILAGAVSMFGGIDPFSGMKKKSLSSEKVENTGSSPQAEIPPPSIDPLSALTSPVTMTTAQTKPASHGNLPKLEVHRSPVTDPMTLSPGVTSPDLQSSLEKSGSVDFDHPADTEILSSANKDRPKLSRRRPQSRKARVQAAANADTGIENVTPVSPITPTSCITPTVLTTPTAQKTSNLQDLPPGASTASTDVAVKEAPHVNHIRNFSEVRSKPKHTDLFGNDDLLDGLSLSTEESQPVAGDRISYDDGIFSKDLIGWKNIKLPNGASEDLFSHVSKHDTVASAGSTIKSAAEKPILANQVISKDLFSDLRKHETVDSAETTIKSSAGKPVLTSQDISVDLFSDLDKHEAVIPSVKSDTRTNKDDLDELFSSSRGKSKLNHLPAQLNQADQHSAATGSKIKVTTELEDDDLFTSSLKSSLTIKSKLTSGTVGGNDLFSTSKPDSYKGDNLAAAETDGSVGIKASADVKKTRTKRAVTKEAKLLGDWTDIFSDIPTSTFRESKRKVTKKTSERNVFKDDMDDIFADTSAATIKPTKDVKRVAQPTVNISDSIFDDPLS